MNARQHFFKNFAATAVASLFALTAQATEFRSSDVHPDALS